MPRHHNSNISRVQQRQIIRGITQTQHPHLGNPETLLEDRQSPSLADPSPKKVCHPIALHDRQPTFSSELLEPWPKSRRRRHKRDAATAPLGLKQTLTRESQELVPLRCSEFIQRPERLSEISG